MFARVALSAAEDHAATHAYNIDHVHRQRIWPPATLAFARIISRQMVKVVNAGLGCVVHVHRVWF